MTAVLVCHRSDQTGPVAAEWTYWDTTEQAQQAQTELTPCSPRCTGIHTIARLNLEPDPRRRPSLRTGTPVGERRPTPGDPAPGTHAPPVALATPPPGICPTKNNREDLKVTDRDDLRAAVRELFADVGERPPGPRYEMTLAAVEDYSRRWVENLGAGRFTTTDADIRVDADGRPSAVGHTVHTFQFNSLLMDRHHTDRLGITAAVEAGEYPGVEVFDPYNTKGNDR